MPRTTHLILLASILVAGFSQHASAEIEDVEAAEARMRSSFINEFTRFMEDKNVQGKVKRPDGKVVSAGPKNRFNADDGLPFQSDLTYHDYSFNTQIDDPQAKQQKNPNDPEPEKKRLFAFVSSHGGVSAAGGSSVLERTAFALDQKYQEQDKQNANQPEQEGVRFRSIFKITTADIFDQDVAADSAAKQDGEQKEKVERFELRDEARVEIDKVGEQSADTIIQAAKGEQAANDPNALGNGVLLRQAGFEASSALVKSTAANLAQRIFNRAIRSGSVGSSVQLSEGVARCEEWSAVAAQVIAQEQDPQRREQKLKDIQRMTDQCKQLSATPLTAVSPEFVRNDKGEEKLEIQGPQKEDPIQRDLRNQLMLLQKAGTSLSELPSNWKYSPEDEKARMTLTFDDGQPKEGSQTLAEQLESYNKNLADSEAAFSDIRSRLPGYVPPKPTDYAIKPGTKSILEINQPPESAFEEVGMKRPAPPPMPDTYEGVLQSNNR